MYEQPSSTYGKLIRVDPDVRARIEALRAPGESINATLRRVFGLEPKGGRHARLANDLVKKEEA